MSTQPTVAPNLRAKLVAAQPNTQRGAIISTCGREGVGKSGWALSACSCGTFVYIGMDRKLQGGYIDELLGTGRILVPKTNFKDLNTGRQFNKDLATKLWDELRGLTLDCIQDKGIRGIIWDTNVYAWTLIRMARLGKLTQVMPHNYGPVNAEFGALFYMAEEAGKIFIAIHTMSKEYKEGKDGKELWTGRYERAGFSHMAYIANIAVEHYKTDDGQFACRVLQNKINPDTDGREYEGDDCKFANLMYETYPDSNVEDWFGV